MKSEELEKKIERLRVRTYVAFTELAGMIESGEWMNVKKTIQGILLFGDETNLPLPQSKEVKSK